MFKSHLARAILCLALVFVLVFNIYAMPTKAIAGEGLFYFGATAVTAALLMGLGIFANQDSTGFDTVHRSFWDHLTELGHIVGDTIPMYMKNGIHYLPKWLVNLGKDWLWDNSILSSSGVCFPEGYTFTLNGETYTAVGGDVFLLHFNDSYNFVYYFKPFSTGGRLVDSSGKSVSTVANCSFSGLAGEYSSQWGYVSLYESKDSIPFSPFYGNLSDRGYTSFLAMFRDAFAGSLLPLDVDVSSPYDISLGDIAPTGEDVLTGMEVWQETAISIPEELQDDDYWNPDPDNNDDDIMVPIGIITGVLLDELNDRLAAQETIQRGEFGEGDGFGPSDFGEGGGFGSEDDDQDVTTGPDSDTGTEDGDQTGDGSDTGTDEDKVTHTRLRDLFDGLGDKLKDWFEGLLSGIQDILDALAGWFDSLIQAVLGIPDKIKEFLIEIFVPSEDYLSEKVNHVRSKFGFAESILATVDLVAASITGSGSEPPVIYVELGNAESSYDYGGTVAILDMSWYATYKPTVDKILSAFLWICFIWKIFKQLPGIIGGMPGDVVFDLVNAAGVADHLPARKMEYQIHRNEMRRLR